MASRMVPIRDSIDQECYLVTKHSWKGKYKRILAIRKTGICTYNPEKYDITNEWPYSDVLSIAPNKSLQSVSIPWSEWHFSLVWHWGANCLDRTQCNPMR